MSNVKECMDRHSRKRPMNWKKTVVFLGVLLLVFLVGTCEFVDSLEDGTTEYEFPSSLQGRNVLVISNTSVLDATLNFSLASRSAGQMNTAIPPRFAGNLEGNLEDRTPRMDLEAASRFNANPPPYPPESSRSAEEGPRYAKEYDFNDQKFWVTDADDIFIEITAKRQASNTYCNVWVDNDSFVGSEAGGEIDAAKAQALASKFADIYPRETALLGYEYGGGISDTADPKYGGIDGDPKIQILVYDIGFDKDFSEEEKGNVIGYFWGKDEYLQTQTRQKTNEAEIFYIDADFLKTQENLVYSTLIHEFQHMINFNRKALRLSTPSKPVASEIWFDEMLAMMAEDVIGPSVGITAGSDGHPIGIRIPSFLGSYYRAGLNQWLDDGSSYPIVYAFGAYLLRNYGGPQLLKAMLDNDAVNQNSINQALASISGNSVTTFDEALARYAEALLYSPTNTGTVPSGKMSFFKAVAYTIPGTSYTYTASAFDIWDMQMSPGWLSQYVSNPLYDVTSDYKGPIIFPLLQSYPLPGYSLRLHKPDNTAGRTLVVNYSPGNATIDMKMVNY